MNLHHIVNLVKIFKNNAIFSIYHLVNSIEKIGNSTIEIFQGKTLNINNNLEEFQKKELIKMLQEHSSTYAWEYTDMKGIDPNNCIIISALNKITNQFDNLKEE